VKVPRNQRAGFSGKRGRLGRRKLSRQKAGRGEKHTSVFYEGISQSGIRDRRIKGGPTRSVEKERGRFGVSGEMEGGWGVVGHARRDSPSFRKNRFDCKVKKDGRSCM